MFGLIRVVKRFKNQKNIVNGVTSRLISKVLLCCFSGDLEEIQNTRDRSGVLNCLRSALEAAFKKQAKIKEVRYDPGKYDLFVIGTPVWAYNMSTPVRAYLERHKTNFSAASYFATCGSTGDSKTLQDMENISGSKPRAQLAIKKVDMKPGIYQEKIKQFVREL